MGPKGYTKGDTLVRLMKNFGWSKDEVLCLVMVVMILACLNKQTTVLRWGKHLKV